MKPVKKENQVTTIQNQNQNQVVTQANLPAHLQNREKVVGLDNLKQYYTPPRLKIIQAQSGDQYVDFKAGDTLLLPQNDLITKSGEPFYIVPFMQFSEYCVWNPYAMKGQLPVIRERTFDYDSPIAKRARLEKKEARLEVCPEAPKAKQGEQNFKLTYCEHINFYCILLNHELSGNPFLISFHHAGFYDGKNFATLIFNRRRDIFAHVYEAKTVDKSNQLGKWKGLQLTNPSSEAGFGEGNFTPADLFYACEEFYNSQFKKFEAGEIRPDYEEEVAEENAPVDSGKF